MNEEEKKAIKEVKHFKELTRYWQEEEYEEKEIAGYIETILNLIEKQQKELEKKDKIIDLMAEKICFFDIDLLASFDNEIQCVDYFTKKVDE